MLETIVVIAVVASAGTFLVWRLVKNLRGETQCCGTIETCKGNCNTCALAKQSERTQS